MSASDCRNNSDNNKRRIERMNAWVDLAGGTPDDDEHAHIRFVFYWIAYEAAYQNENRDSEVADWRERDAP